MKRLRWALPLVVLIVAAGAATSAGAAARTLARSTVPRASAATATLPPIKHVFTIILENENEQSAFGTGSTAPYLANTLTSEGAFVPNYYGTGHHSNDNYISMISGQAPNTDNQADCGTFSDFTPDLGTGANGQQQGIGCVYPTAIQTIANQFTNAGMTWRSYNQDMGLDPSREASVCAHPAVGTADPTEGGESTAPYDQYATKHNPFVYFHSIIDNTAMCDANVVNLSALQGDLASASKTPNYVFITPDLCADGHNATCGDPSRLGGFAGINQFLQQYVPMIMNSPAYKTQNGLIIVTFDESASDNTSCCGEIAGPGAMFPGDAPGATGGGQTGAVLLSPCIKPGTVTQTAYNHYSMLASLENMFGFSHLGMAQVAGLSTFGSDIFNKPCEAPPVPKISAKAKKTKITVKWSATDTGGPGVASYTVGERTAGKHPGKFKTLKGLGATTKTSTVFKGKKGKSYQFEVKATDKSGIASTYVVSKIVKVKA